MLLPGESMILFLTALLLLFAALEAYTLHDGLSHITFTYGPDVLCTEPDAVFHTRLVISNTGVLPVSYVRATVFLPRSLDKNAEETKEDPFRFLKPASGAGRLLSDRQEINERFFIYGRRRVTRKVESRIAKRGVHLFDSAQLTRGDFLGLREISKTEYGTSYILVYPKRLESDEYSQQLESFLGETAARRFLMRDPILTIGVREYTGTEPMHTISWSATARRSQLMVREFDYTRDPACTVLFCVSGLGPLENAVMDRCCSLARSVCEALTAKGIAVHFHTNAQLYGHHARDVFSCQAAEGKEDALLEALARAQNAVSCSAEDLALNAVRTEGDNTAYIIIAPSMNIHTRALVDTLDNYRGAASPSLVLTADSLAEEEGSFTKTGVSFAEVDFSFSKTEGSFKEAGK